MTHLLFSFSHGGLAGLPAASVLALIRLLEYRT
jgi:hypothetical protein